MKYRLSNILILLSVIIPFVFSSCAEEIGTGSLKILLHSNISKTITGGNSSSDIVRFSVSGTGPGGKSFAVDSSSSVVTVDGLLLGEWSIKAYGYNSASKAVSEGEATVRLENSYQSISVELNTMTGNGSLQVKFTWDEDVTSPVLDVRMYEVKNNEELLNRNIEVGSQRTYFNFSVTEIPCGTYLLIATLYNENIKVGGVAEAVRITNGDKTTGNLSLNYGTEYDGDLETLFVVTDSETPITGHIDGIASVVSSGKTQKAALVLDSYYNQSMNYTIQWYLDGELLTTEMLLQNTSNEVSFNIVNGTHILNAVVFNRSLNTVGSVGIKFVAKPLAKKGVPVYGFTAVDSSGLKLASDSIVGALPDSRFVVLTPSECILQLCSIYNNQLVVHSKYTAAMEGFGWLVNAERLVSSSEMNVFAVIDSKNNINFLLFNGQNDELELACFEGKTERYEGSIPSMEVTLGDIGYAGSFPSGKGGGMILFCDNTSRIIIGTICDDMSVTGRTLVIKPENYRTISSFGINSSIAICASEKENAFYLNSFNGKSFTQQWTSAYCRVQQIDKIVMLNSQNAVVSGCGLLCKYVRYSSSGWQWSQSFEIEVNSVVSSQDGNYVYLVDSKNNLVTFSAYTGRLVKISEIELPGATRNLVINGLDLVCECEDGSLVVYCIAQEDVL